MLCSSIESNHELEIDDKSGLPRRLRLKSAHGEHVVNLMAVLALESDGSEVRAPSGGIEYLNTNLSNECETNGAMSTKATSRGFVFSQPIKIGVLSAQINYLFPTHGPALEVSLTIIGHESVVVRDLTLSTRLEFESGEWVVNIPGNGLRANVPLETISETTGISPLGGLRGSSGLAHLSSTEFSLALWSINDIEIPQVVFEGLSSQSAEITIKSGFASDLSLVSSIDIPLLALEMTSSNWSEFPPIFDSWLRSRDISSPANPPEWIKGAMLFEAQIGYSVFSQVNKYGPYPQVSDLILDLDRIKSLGFSCIQLMPRQPYPSYNVHDYWNIDVSYGPKDQMKTLVQEAHKRGIRVILDVLLHGVLDKEIIKIAADGVRSGPFQALINSDTDDSFSSDVKDWQNYLIAWSRHIIDFEPYWSAGSPDKSHLESENPDWFYRFSNGEIAGVYTKAFDARNATWRDYFTEGMKYLVNELDIDGFRFDAPTYNDFNNWAPWARYRASSSALACTGLFEEMRPIFKKMKPDFLFYTEPSGHSLRRSMDLNYNYDEQWLVTALANEAVRKPWGVRNGKDIARWMADRDSLLPRGSMTAHHIDSHDTFWWPSWGKKWRREQFGIQMTQLLTVMFASLPGPFMMFIGGEEGIEELLPKLSELKQSLAYQNGAVKWWVEEKVNESLFGISYINNDEGKSILVNTGNSEITGQLPGHWRIDFMDLLVGSAEAARNSFKIGANSAMIIDHRVLS